MARVHLTWSLQRPPVKFRLSPVPWLGTRRAPSTGASYNTGALLAALSDSSSAGCTRRTVLALPRTVDRAGDVPAFGRCGYRQIRTVTRFQAHPSGLLNWSRGPCSRAAGGSLLTGAILKARSTGGVSGSFANRLSNPNSSMQGGPSSQALLSFTNFK